MDTALPNTPEGWTALHGQPEAVHLAVAEHLNATRVALSLSSMSGVMVHAGLTYNEVTRALRAPLLALTGNNVERAERVHHALLTGATSVADALARVRAETTQEHLAIHAA